jgi:hypothetical protein
LQRFAFPLPGGRNVGIQFNGFVKAKQGFIHLAQLSQDIAFADPGGNVIGIHLQGPIDAL